MRRDGPALVPSVSTDGDIVLVHVGLVDRGAMRLTTADALLFAEEVRVNAEKAAVVKEGELQSMVDDVAAYPLWTEALRDPMRADLSHQNELKAMGSGLLMQLRRDNSIWRRTPLGDRVLQRVDAMLK